MRYLLLLILMACPAYGLSTEIGRETGLPTPRFVSLKSAEVNMRKGPGTRYPIEWVYRRANVPVEITEEFGHWRRIRDHDGAAGWLHKQMLSGNRTALITAADELFLRSKPQHDAPRKARLEPGVIATLKECELNWCLLEVGSHEGWLEKTKFYGAYDKELYNP